MPRGFGWGRGWWFGFPSWGRGFGFRGFAPPWPFIGWGRSGLPKCWWPFAPYGIYLKSKLFKRFIHDDYYNEGCILNFRKKEVIYYARV
jgi:hypothetical protein